jgi:hypothetical protein
MPELSMSPHFRIRLAFALNIAMLSFSLGGCGSINLGAGGSTSVLNDPIPEGSLRSQGNFTGQNGKTASGSVAVYQLSNSFSYVVRLQGITVPNETGLVVQVYGVPSTPLQTFVLRSSTGSQNYSLPNLGASTLFKSVVIYSQTANLSYAFALLQ